MKSIARYNSAFITLSAILVLTTSSGCEDSNKMHGLVMNSSQWQLVINNPGNYPEKFVLNPGGYFGSTADGSRVLHCHAELPDGTVYADFDLRINQIRNDAQINGGQFSWYWNIDGATQAIVMPIDPNRPQQYSITIENFRTGLKNVSAPNVAEMDRTKFGRMLDDMSSSVKLARPASQAQLDRFYNSARKEK